MLGLALSKRSVLALLFPGLQGWGCSWRAQLSGLGVSLASPARDRVLAQPNLRVGPGQALCPHPPRMEAVSTSAAWWDGRGGDRKYPSRGFGVEEQAWGTLRGANGGDIQAGRGCQDWEQLGGTWAGGMNRGQYGRVCVTGGEPWLPTYSAEPPLNPFMSLA